jgi:hypothetical protein
LTTAVEAPRAFKQAVPKVLLRAEACDVVMCGRCFSSKVVVAQFAWRHAQLPRVPAGGNTPQNAKQANIIGAIQMSARNLRQRERARALEETAQFEVHRIPCGDASHKSGQIGFDSNKRVAMATFAGCEIRNQRLGWMAPAGGSGAPPAAAAA